MAARMNDQDFSEIDISKLNANPPPPYPDDEDIDVDDEDDSEDFIPQAPDGGWGWVIVFASLMCNVIVDGICFCFGILMIEFVDYYKESTAKTAMVGSLLSGVYLTMGPIVSGLANKYGCRTVTIVGGFVSAAAFVLSIFSPNVDVLIVTFGILGGIGFGLIYLPAIVIVGYWFERRRALATGIAVCGSGIGTFVFAPIVKSLIDAFGWKGAVLILAGVSLNCAVFGALFRPVAPPKPKTRKITMMERCMEAKRARMARWDSECSEEALAHQKIKLECERNHSLADMPWKESPPQNILARIRKSLLNIHLSRSSFDENQANGGNLTVLSHASRSHNNLRSNTVGEGSGTANGVDKRRNRLSVPWFTEFKVNSDPTPDDDSNGGYSYKYVPPEQDIWIKRIIEQHQHEEKRRREVMRPLYRKDIFFSGSIIHLPEYLSSPDIRSYVNSNVCIPAEVPDEEETRLLRCLHLSKAFTDTVRQMLNFSLLKSPLFSILCVSSVFSMIGFYVPFVYITGSALQKGVDLDSATFLLSVLGIANTIGRVISGYISDFPKVDCLIINNSALIIAGVATMIYPHANSYGLMAGYASTFGLCIACFVSLRSIILVDLLGLERLTNAFGILLMFQGLAALIGSPLAGLLFDLTGDYSASFYSAGALIALSGVICIPLRRIADWEKRRNDIIDGEVKGEGDTPPNYTLVDQETVV